jgi:NADH-quinone oxidoreductase subunit N
MWLTDVYEGAATPVTAYFAITPKIIILGVLIRLYLFTFYSTASYSLDLFLYCSAASILVASFAALYQVKIIRLFAYSAISHVGFMFIGVATGYFEGIQASFLYIIIYMIMTVSVFTIIISLRQRTDYVRIKYLRELFSMGKINTYIAFTLVTVLFSMAGIPPLAGFFSKLYVFNAAINANLNILAVIAIFASVLAAVYYIYIIRIMYFEKSDSWVLLQQFSKENSIVLAVTFLTLIFFFIDSSFFMLLTHYIALFIAL